MGLIDWFLNLLIPDESSEQSTSSSHRKSRGGSSHQSGNVEGNAATGTMLADAPDDEQDDTPWWTPEGVTQTEPIEPTLPQLSTQGRALENTLVSHFDGHDLAMPPLPLVTERVLSRLRDGKASLKQIADDIAEDQVVAAEIIRMANSVLYRGLYQATTLQAAVTRLGVKAVRTCILNQSMRAAMFSKKGTDHELAALVWYQSLAGSYIMRALAGMLNIDEEEASLIGLMHDIGNVIVLRFVEEYERIARTSLDVPTFDYLCHETHQEFGELVAEAWKMPDTLKSIVSSHHAYPEQDDPLRKERLMIILTDMICSMLGYAPAAKYALLQSRVVHDLGLDTRAAFEPFLYKLEVQLEETLASFGVVSGSPELADSDGNVNGMLPAWLRQIRISRCST